MKPEMPASSSNELNRVCPVCSAAFFFKETPFNSNRGRGIFCSVKCFYESKRWVPEMFWAQVEKTDGCWIWTGNLTKSGYGQTAGPNKTHWRAHRLSWQMVNGPIPEGLMVCHNCPAGDNKKCVRPDHLYLGTHADNVKDAMVKGQYLCGENAGSSKLKTQDILEIRRLYSLGNVTYLTLSNQFNIAPINIKAIVKKLAWKHIP